MGKLYLTLVLTFAILVLIHVVFAAINLYLWATNGLQALLGGMNLVERIYYSVLLKWILLADVIWLLFALIFMLKRKHYKTDPILHYLVHKPILNPVICVIIPTYNEELVIEKVVKEFINRKNVKYVIVIDNHSADHTAEIAEQCGAKVIRKEFNKGYAHSCIVGLKESLKTDANIIVLTECDGTFSGHDLEKMVPYLDNCEMVIGTRQVQVLTEKGNQNSMLHVWGNFFLAKLIQIKYFSLRHMGIVNLTDVGCSYRCIRRDALEKIIEQFTYYYDKKHIDPDGWLFVVFFTMIGIENDLRIVEVPITFKKRVGISKSQASKKTKGILYGLRFMWYIISS
ncbi:MAG: glycosyltransferase family 2 protein [Nitrosopumilaceae archaeon]